MFSPTPHEVTAKVLAFLHPQMADDRIVTCTIRTIEWLPLRQGAQDAGLIGKMRQDYEHTGLGYVGKNGSEDDIPASDYGDTIILPQVAGGRLPAWTAI